MSVTKRLMDENEDREKVATSLAVEAGALESCDIHGSFFRGDAEIVSAYKLGNAKFESDGLGTIFSDRTEMTDTIKRVVENIGGTECYQCASYVRYLD